LRPDPLAAFKESYFYGKGREGQARGREEREGKGERG